MAVIPHIISLTWLYLETLIELWYFYYLIRKLMTASACCFSRTQCGSATWVWAHCLFGSPVPSLAVRFMPRLDDVIVGGATGSLWVEPPSWSIGSPSESLASRTYTHVHTIVLLKIHPPFKVIQHPLPNERKSFLIFSKGHHLYML